MTAMHPIEPRGSARAKRSRRSRAGAVAPPAGVVAGAAQVSPAGPAQVDPSPQAAGASLGSYLRQQRERRAMSVAELARITRIPSTSLEAMEADRFDELPGEVFVRGFLRAYAQAVRLLPAEVLARYTSSRRASYVTPLPMQTPLQAPRDVQGRRFGVAIAFVLLLILLSLALSIVLKPRGRDMPAELSQIESFSQTRL